MAKAAGGAATELDHGLVLHLPLDRAQFWKNPTVLGAASSGPGLADVAVMLEDGKPGYHHGLEPQQDVSLFSDRTIHDGQWHHLALTRDVDSKGTLYLNELSLDANLQLLEMGVMKAARNEPPRN